MEEQRTPPVRKPRIRRLTVVLIAIAIVLVAAFIATEYGIHHAEPILRARIIKTLSTRFDSQVQLARFHVTVTRGIGVEGQALSLRSNRTPDLPPLIQVDRFSFHTSVLDLFRSPMHLGEITLHGLVIHVPPKERRTAMPRPKKGGRSVQVIVDRIVCDDALLVLMTSDPKKVPLTFKIHALTLRRAGSHSAMTYSARLVNPRPIGDIATTGHFGPWDEESPHRTPLDGIYSFTNADLSTTKGISGTLSSEGRFSGQLESLAVDGHTDTPDFSVNVSGQKVALHTDFHAIVDGTNGNTYLQPVNARFLQTSVVAKGYVVRGADGKGHHVYLDVKISKGRVQDLLRIGARNNPPVMRGPIRLQTSFDLPTGTQSVIHRLRLNGRFAIDNASFFNPKLQKGVEELSLRGQGQARKAREIARGTLPPGTPLSPVPLAVHGVFSLANQKITFPQLVCTVPGAQVALAGTYTLDGKQFDFAGQARMDAHLSGIIGGWKGALLRPADPLFARHGAGTEVPIRITGTKSSPHIGLNF